MSGSENSEQEHKAPSKRGNNVGCYMLRPFAHPVACCCVLLCFVGNCCAKFETAQTRQQCPGLLLPFARSLKRVTRKCLEVSRRSHAKQRQRNVQKRSAARAKLFFFLLIRPIVFLFFCLFVCFTFSLPSHHYTILYFV